MEGKTWGRIEENYHQFKAVNNSRLKKWLKSPAEYWENIPVPFKKDFTFGKSFESLVMDAENWGDSFELFTKPLPDNNMNKKENKEAWNKIFEEGREAVSEDDLYMMGHMGHYVNHPYGDWPENMTYSPDFFCNHPESQYHAAFWWIHEESGLKLKCEFDNLIVTKVGETPTIFTPDLKTCLDATEKGFLKACRDYHYPCQAAYYNPPWDLIYPDHEVHPMPFVMCPKTTLPIPEVHYVPEWQLESIRGWIDRTLCKIAAGEDKRGNIQPFNAGMNQVILPDYYMNQFEN